jgi:secreted protein with Ig-like and vWFA domain
VKYIASNKAQGQVHTFGIGNGVSTELIRDCARAGGGNATFISDAKEIEPKVLEALQKNFFPYLVAKDFTLIMDSGEEFPLAIRTPLVDGQIFDL